MNTTVVKPVEPRAGQSTLFYRIWGMTLLLVIDVIHHSGDDI